MFRKIFLLFILGFCWSLGALATEPAESTDTTSMYRYVLDNYFSKRGGAKTDYYGSFSRYFFLSSSVDFYRVKADKNFSPFSAFDLSYTQNVREISRFGDLQFRVSALSSLLEKKRVFSLELTPLLTVPEAPIRFPVYLSLGLGAGIYPLFLIESQQAFSFHGVFLAGLRFFDLYHNLGLALELQLKAYYPLELSEIYLQTNGGLHLIVRF